MLSICIHTHTHTYTQISSFIYANEEKEMEKEDFLTFSKAIDKETHSKAAKKSISESEPQTNSEADLRRYL